MQNRVGDKKWETLGHVLSPIDKRDSYNIELDNLQEDIYHRRHIRKEQPFIHLEREFPNLDRSIQRKNDITPNLPTIVPELRTCAQTRNNDLEREFPNLDRSIQRRNDVTPSQQTTVPELRTCAQTRNSRLQNRA